MSDFNKRYVKLDDLGSVGRGKSKHRPRNDSTLFGGKYPFIQTGDVRKAEFYLSKYSETYNEKGLAQSKLWNENTLCITIAANIAENAILGIKACFPDSIIGFIPDEKKADLKFIKYCLDTYKIQMQSISQGATQDNLSLEKLRSINFHVPDLNSQIKIGSTLFNYDKLIENNTKRITILEQMTEQIFKEWFVRMRFPGHEKTKFIKGIPQGWNYDYIDNHIKIYRGKSYSSSELREVSDLPMINLKNINRDGGYRRDGIKYFEGKYSENNIVNEGDIIMAVTDMTQNREIVGRVAIVPKSGFKKLIFSMDIIRLEPKCLPKLFTYSFFRYSGIGHVLKEFANGANVLHLNPKVVTSQKVLIPKLELCQKFNELVLPLVNQVDLLHNQNEILIKSRNLLLPRLISGKLSVQQAEITLQDTL